MKEKGYLTTREAAAKLGLSVRTVQLMADRNDLRSWKKPGGEAGSHRRIVAASVEFHLHNKRLEVEAKPHITYEEFISMTEGREAPSFQGSGEAPLHGQESMAAAPSLSNDSLRVLIMDDSSYYLRSIPMLLDSKFDDLVRVSTADGPDEAFSVFKSFKPHVAVVDLKMPEMSGDVAISKMIEISKSEKIDCLFVLNTAATEEEILSAQAVLPNSVRVIRKDKSQASSLFQMISEEISRRGLDHPV